LNINILRLYETFWALIHETSLLYPIMEDGRGNIRDFSRLFFPSPRNHQREVFILRLITADTPHFPLMLSQISPWDLKAFVDMDIK